MDEERPLDSDELGEVGQALFVGMCATGKLVCNESKRDRVGWDYIVSFRFDKDTQPLDSRKVPPSCHVQVKTIWDWNSDVSLRLTSAEYLAKEAKPAFICVFRINSRRECTDCFLIHVFDKPLAAILRRLRLEQSQGTTAPNHKFISMSVSNGEQIAANGDSLRDALTKAIGPDLHKYIATKLEQVRTLGFGPDAIQVKGRLHAKSQEELVDALLGLGDGIRATNLEVTQTRFSIPLPLQMVAETVLRITPNAADSCTIVVRSDQFAIPAVFKGEMFTPAIADLPLRMRKARIVSELFSITLSIGEGELQYTIITEPGDAPKTVSSWMAFWKLLLVVALGKGTIELSKDSDGSTVPVAFLNEPNPTEEGYARKMLAACEAAANVVRLAGAAREPLVTFEQLGNLAARAQIANAIAGHGGAVPITLSAPVPDNMSDESQAFLAYISYVWFGTMAVGYCAKVSFEFETTPNGRILVSKDWKLLEARTVQKFPDEWEAFVEGAIRNAGLEATYVESPTWEKQTNDNVAGIP